MPLTAALCCCCAVLRLVQAEGCCNVLAPSEILDTEPGSEIPGTEGFVGQIANDIDRELAEPRPRPLIFPFSTVVASAQCHRLVRSSIRPFWRHQAALLILVALVSDARCFGRAQRVAPFRPFVEWF